MHQWLYTSISPGPPRVSSSELDAWREWDRHIRASRPTSSLLLQRLSDFSVSPPRSTARRKYRQTMSADWRKFTWTANDQSSLVG